MYSQISLQNKLILNKLLRTIFLNLNTIVIFSSVSYRNLRLWHMKQYLNLQNVAHTQWASVI